jgi:hypothetical protein
MFGCEVLMIDNSELISRIVEIEWKMFQNVQAMGGRAACQDDFQTFKINRTGQAMSWSKATLESYRQDLSEADQRGRNLVTEKYAYMMKSTLPEEYARIEHLLPILSDEAIALIEDIVQTVLSWEEEVQNKYPNIVKHGRPLHTAEDGGGNTSVETYLRGELSTYSLRTLKLYEENIKQLKARNTNGSEITLKYMMERYGFKSLAEANDKLV